MKMTLMLNLLSVFAFCSLVAISTVNAADQGKVKGTVTVGKEKIDLKFAYAHQSLNEDGMDEGPELRVLLTDREVSGTLLFGYNAPFKLDALAKKGKVRGVYLKFDSKKLKEGLSGTLLYPPDNPQASLTFFTLGGSEYIKKIQIKDKKVTGEIAGEQIGGSLSDKTTGFSAVFEIPLLTEEPATKLTGAQAVKSAPAQAYLVYMRALYKGDFNAARLASAPGAWDHKDAYIAQVGEAEFTKMMKQYAPDPATAEKQIKTVLIWGARAVIIVNENGGKSARPMIQIDGAWKVD